MPTYEYECSEGHPFEVRSSISNKPDHPACPCPVGTRHRPDLCDRRFSHAMDEPFCEFCPEESEPCEATSRQVIRTVPIAWIPGVNKETVLDYPGSKRLKAGYIHHMVDPGVKKVSSGYGGMLNPQTKERHPIGKAVQAEWKIPAE